MRYIFATLIMFAILSCTNSYDSICLSDQQSVQVELLSAYTSTSTEDEDTTLTNFSAFGVGNEGSLLYDSASVNSLFLPLDMNNDYTTFVLGVGSLKDSLRCYYSRELNFVSNECGYVFDFTIDSIAYTRSSLINEVTIIYPDVIYAETFDNVKIYIY